MDARCLYDAQRASFCTLAKLPTTSGLAGSGGERELWTEVKAALLDTYWAPDQAIAVGQATCEHFLKCVCVCL